MQQATTTTILLASLGLTAIYLSFILFRSYRMRRFIKCASFYVMRDVVDSLEKAEEHVSKANVIRLQHKFEDRVKAVNAIMAHAPFW